MVDLSTSISFTFHYGNLSFSSNFFPSFFARDINADLLWQTSFLRSGSTLWVTMKGTNETLHRPAVCGRERIRVVFGVHCNFFLFLFGLVVPCWDRLVFGLSGTQCVRRVYRGGAGTEITAEGRTKRSQTSKRLECTVSSRDTQSVGRRLWRNHVKRERVERKTLLVTLKSGHVETGDRTETLSRYTGWQEQAILEGEGTTFHFTSGPWLKTSISMGVMDHVY